MALRKDDGKRGNMNENGKTGHISPQQKSRRASESTVPTKQYTYTEHGFREVPCNADMRITRQQLRQRPATLQKNYNSVKKTKRKKSVFIFGSLFFLIVIVLAFMLLIPRGADPLKGTWACDAVTVYDFDGSGTGTLILPTVQYAFSYSIQEDQLHIDFIDERITDTVYTFTIQENTLTFINSDGLTRFSLTKQ